jgi:hypothetical protein
MAMIRALGMEDIYLTGNPQLTFYKIIYKKHTDIVLESISEVSDISAVSNTNCVMCLQNMKNNKIDYWINQCINDGNNITCTHCMTEWFVTITI